HIRDGGAVLGVGFDTDVDAILADLEREGGNAVAEGRGAVERAVVVTVPRAAEHALLDRPLAEGAALVRAAVRERRVLSVAVGDGEAVPASSDCLHASIGKLVGLDDAIPGEV